MCIRDREQAAAFALEHDTAQQNTAELPAFLDMHLIEANLLDDGGRKHKRQEIFGYFQAHKSLCLLYTSPKGIYGSHSHSTVWVSTSLMRIISTVSSCGGSFKP